MSEHPRSILLMYRMLLLTVCLACFATRTLAAEETPQKDELGRDYYVYAPPRIDPKRTYWLVVGVHGFGGDGKGAAGLAGWGRRGDCVVVGPSFPNNGYQLLRERSDEQLVRLFDRLKQQYPLRPKLFIYGFSGGGQFAHRFLMAHPELVAGCSAHSAGSWATGDGWGDVNPAAADVPLAMSCGASDTGKMTPDAPMSRLAWAKAFERKLSDGGFCYEARYWPNVAHAASPGVAAMTVECYRLATQVVPAHEQAIASVRDLIRAGKQQEARAALARLRRITAQPARGLAKAVADQQMKEEAAVEKELGGN